MAVIALDVGGTNIRAALVSRNKIVRRAVSRTVTKRGSKGLLAAIRAAVISVKGRGIEGIGVSIAGEIKGGIVLSSPNLPLKNYPLAARLRQLFRVPVRIENDAKCFLLGEQHHGIARKTRHAVGITLGTGLGGSVVSEGTLLRGRGQAGHLGHMIISVDGRKCSCGSHGCLEEYVSARALMRYAHGLKAGNPEEVYRLALRGNPKARAAFRKFGHYLGIAMSNIVNLFDPDIIVVGGNISKAWKFFLPKARATMKALAWLDHLPAVRKSKLGDDAALLGAAGLLA